MINMREMNNRWAFKVWVFREPILAMSAMGVSQQLSTKRGVERGSVADQSEILFQVEE